MTEKLILPNEKPDIVYFGEKGYLQLLADIMEHGSNTPDRTGVGRKKLFERFLRFDLRDGFPAFTVRNTQPKPAFKEFWLFLNGELDVHTKLSAEGINFWKGNTSREFLDARGLEKLPVGHIGKSYSFQIRNFGGDYDENFNAIGGTDQLSNIYNTLKNNPYDSRIMLSMWNPEQEHEMSLPPCWWGHQFLVTIDKNGNNVLNLSVNSRSADLLFGCPYNVPQYAIYLAAMAKAHNMIAGEFSCRFTDVHIYGKDGDLDRPQSENNPASQFRYVKETLSREYSDEKVTLKFNKDLNSLEDILSLKFEDLEFINYNPNLTKYVETRPQMAV